MADKKLSSVNSVSDASFIYAETSSGETVKISKADLASVVAGVMGYDSSEIYMNRNGLSSSDNLDDIRTPGSYRLSGMSTNNNCPVVNGMLLVFRQAATTVQLCFSSTASELHMRIYWTTGWYGWIRV